MYGAFRATQPSGARTYEKQTKELWLVNAKHCVRLAYLVEAAVWVNDLFALNQILLEAHLSELLQCWLEGRAEINLGEQLVLTAPALVSCPASAGGIGRTLCLFTNLLHWWPDPAWCLGWFFVRVRFSCYLCFFCRNFSHTIITTFTRTGGHNSGSILFFGRLPCRLCTSLSETTDCRDARRWNTRSIFASFT